MPSCVIGLCVLNNEFGIPFVFENISKLKKIFDRIKIVVFYDHSNDKSLELIQHLSLKYGLSTDIIVNETRLKLFRTYNIAIARNNIIDAINIRYLDYDYFIMMDTNHYACIGKINTDIIQTVLNRSDEWDAISFNREDGYYDLWALSYDPYIYSMFHFIDNNKTVQMLRNDVNRFLSEKTKDDPKYLIPVYSAFNGFCLYKLSKFTNCKYSANINLDLFPKNSIKKHEETVDCKIVYGIQCDCEHRHFHLEAIHKNGAKIRIYNKPLFGLASENNTSRL